MRCTPTRHTVLPSVVTWLTVLSLVGACAQPALAARRSPAAAQNPAASSTRSGLRLELPSDAIREFNRQLDAKLSADAAVLRSGWGYQFEVNARVENPDLGVGTVVQTDSRGNALVQFDGQSGRLYQDWLIVQPAAGETRFRFRSEDGNPVTPGTVKGLLETREIYVAQMNAFAASLERLASLTLDQRVAMARRLRNAASEVGDAYQLMTRARAAALVEQAGIVTSPVAGSTTVQEEYLELRGKYFALLDKNPVLGLRQRSFRPEDDEPAYLWQVFDSRSTIDTPQADYIVLTDYLRTSATETRRLATQAAGFTRFEDIWKFGSAQYGAQHRSGMKLARITGSTLIGNLIQEARWNVASADTGTALDAAEVDIALNAIGALALLIPVFGPFIAAGVGGVQIYRDAEDVYAVYGALDQAIDTGGVTGFQRVAVLEDKAAETAGKLFISVAAGTFDGLDAALTGFKLVRQARAPANVLDAALPAVLARSGDEIPIPATSRTGSPSARVEGALPNEYILPNGVRARVTEVAADDAVQVLQKIDAEELGRFNNLGVRAEPGDATFFTRNGLAPEIAIDIGGRRFYVSRPFQGPDGRISVVAFEETALGTVVPRTFYLSGEHGIWRAATAYVPGFIAKGPVVRAGNYIDSVNKAAADLGVELQAPLGRLLERRGVATLPDEAADRAFFGHLEYDLEGGQAFAQRVRGVDVDLPLPTGATRAGGELAPPGAPTADLTAGPLDSWSYQHPQYGKVDAAVYRSTDGDMLFLVLRDAQGRVWVPSIQDANAGLTPFGTRWSAYQPGSLNSTPLVKDNTGLPLPGQPGYFNNPFFDNNFNRQFRDPLAGFLDGFNPIGSLGDLGPPIVRPAAPVRAVRATATAPGAEAAGSRAAGPPPTRGVARRTAGGAANTANAFLDATNFRVEETQSLLTRKRLPTTADELTTLLESIPTASRGARYQQVQKARDTLRALETKRAELRGRVVNETSAGDPAVPEGREAPIPSGAAGDNNRPGGTIGARDIGEWRTDPSALNAISGPVDDRVQKMVIELRTPGQINITIPPSGIREVAVSASRSAGLVEDKRSAHPDLAAQHALLRDPMAGLRDAVFRPGVSSIGVGGLQTTQASATWTSWSGGAGGAPAYPATATWRRTAIATTPSRPQQQVQMFLQNIGSSTGEAFVARIFNHTDEPVELSPGAVLVEPLEQPAQQLLQQQLGSLTGFNPAQFDLTAYCVEYLKLPPLANSVFRIASSELQGQLGPISDILDASQRLMDLGELVPDSDPVGYFHSIRQWSIWSHEEGFDSSGFVRAFVQHTRGQMEAAGRPWDDAMERSLRDAAGKRWADIQRVLNSAQIIGR